jgi:hypothetical protein
MEWKTMFLYLIPSHIKVDENYELTIAWLNNILLM